METPPSIVKASRSYALAGMAALSTIPLFMALSDAPASWGMAVLSFIIAILIPSAGMLADKARAALRRNNGDEVSILIAIAFFAR